MAPQERQVGGEEAPLAVVGRRASGSDQHENTYTTEDAENLGYSELLRGFFEKFLRWQEILHADACGDDDHVFRFFDVYRSGNGSFICPAKLTKMGNPKDRILRVLSNMPYGPRGDVTEFIIHPGKAGEHLLTDPEDQRSLEEVNISLLYIPAHQSIRNRIRESVTIQTLRLEELREGDKYRDPFHSEASYLLDGDTLTVTNGFRAVDYYGRMTDETAASIINTIDSLIPQANPQLSEPPSAGEK